MAAASIFDLSQNNWFILLTYILIPCLLLIVIYRWLTDPLRAVPGPFLAKCTAAWSIILELSGHRSTTIHALHKKHGSVVRIGPRELCFNSPQAVKEIYAANSNFAKAPIYDSLGFESTFTTRNRDRYRSMKKRIVPSFNEAAVREMEVLVRQQTANLIKCFDKRVDQPLDVLPWFRMLALGVVGEGFAQDSFGGLENEKTPDLLQHIDEVFPALWVWWMFPITSKILQYSPSGAIRKFLKSADEFRKYCRTAYHNYLSSHDPSAHHDLVARMINERTALVKAGQQLPRHVSEEGIVDELTNLIFAGTDTTGNTLSYLFWELAHHPEWQQRLRKELENAIGHRVDYAYDTISELPVLEAVVQEVLRLRPAAPASLQRLAPEGGCVIDGVAVPAQTIVSCQALSTQREEIIFPDPDSFVPQRWIDAGKTDKLDSMREQIMVFGKGARACLGRKLAMMEIKYATAAIVQRFDVEIGSATTDDDMQMTCHTVLVPKGQRCVLRLSRV